MSDPSDATAAPALSVIVPARNAAATLGRCLESLLAQAADDTEVLVVDDASTDETAEIASRHAVRLVRLAEHRGVSAARNAGAAAARAPLLLFLDADVAPGAGLLARGRRWFTDSEVDAVIGSYDDEPAHRATVSLFKNLAHHHFHQRSPGPTTTFWGACGFIRRDLFARSGGFDERRFHLPSIEDVEIGDRLAGLGARMLLDPELTVKHLKRWTLWSVVATDVRRRAIPWTELWLERRRLPQNLNFQPGQRLAAALAVAGLALGVAAPFSPAARLALAAVFPPAVWINRDLYALFLRKGGLRLAVAGFFLQQLYYLYSLAGLAAGLGFHLAGRAWPRVARVRRGEVVH